MISVDSSLFYNSSHALRMSYKITLSASSEHVTSRSSTYSCNKNVQMITNKQLICMDVDKNVAS